MLKQDLINDFIDLSSFDFSPTLTNDDFFIQAIDKYLEDNTNLLDTNFLTNSNLENHLTIKSTLLILERTFQQIKHLENKQNQHNKFIKKLEKDIRAIDPYIKGFENSLEFFQEIDDEVGIYKTKFALDIFKQFRINPQKAMDILFMFKNTKEITKNHSEEANKKLLNALKKGSVEKYEEALKSQNDVKKDGEYWSSVYKFFEGYQLTKKMLLTSASIKIFSLFDLQNEEGRYRIKDIIETIFAKLGEKVIIYPEQIMDVKIKTYYMNSAIYAYSSKVNDNKKHFDLDDLQDQFYEKFIDGMPEHFEPHFGRESTESLKINFSLVFIHNMIIREIKNLIS